MPGRECYHCKKWIEDGEDHDCWTTTEAALTQDLSDDLRDAWERLRETAVSFGEQRISAPEVVRDPTRQRFPIPVRLVLRIVGADGIMELSVR